MEYIMKRENGDVLIVTHSAIIMALRCYIAGLPFDRAQAAALKQKAEADIAQLRCLTYWRTASSGTGTGN